MNYSLTLARENRIHRLKSIQILTFKGEKKNLSQEMKLHFVLSYEVIARHCDPFPIKTSAKRKNFKLRCPSNCQVM